MRIIKTAARVSVDGTHTVNGRKLVRATNSGPGTKKVFESHNGEPVYLLTDEPAEDLKGITTKPVKVKLSRNGWRR